MAIVVNDTPYLVDFGPGVVRRAAAMSPTYGGPIPGLEVKNLGVTLAERPLFHGFSFTFEKGQRVGVAGRNGVGKTTTIGKLARRFKDQGFSVMLAAGDTFRAAAVEQLQAWGERNDVPVIAQQAGADPAAVIFDAMDAAKARDIDILLADTAGRLQSQSGLMDELAKVRRVISRRDETAPHEIMLVLDASQGQNALVQAEKFHEALGLTGITVTKLDGSAKGGILLAIADRIGVPVRFIGIGESPNEVVMRFATRLEDDQYRLLVKGTGDDALLNEDGYALNDTDGDGERRS